jgi:hypothetical protein
MPDPFIIVPGRAGDYEALARFHYRAGPPATCVRVLCAADRESGELIGVLTVSMPTLNGPWRAGVWPGLFSVSKRETARRINANLRTISRVIIDPRFRALGVARRLVETYLGAPLTPLTEAVAAMGRFCPFFERAGMREVRGARSARDRRLGRVLREAGVRPHELIELTRSGRLVRRSPALRGALRTWANNSRATRRLACGGLTTVAALAGAALQSRPRVYVAPGWGGAHGIRVGGRGLDHGSPFTLSRGKL